MWYIIIHSVLLYWIFILFSKYVVRHGIESFPTPNQQQRPLALRIPPTRTMWSMSLVRDSNHQLCHHREARLDVGFWNNLIFWLRAVLVSKVAHSAQCLSVLDFQNSFDTFSKNQYMGPIFLEIFGSKQNCLTSHSVMSAESRTLRRVSQFWI